MLLSKDFGSVSHKQKELGFGEWLDEVDYLKFTHLTIDCLIVRHYQGFLIGLCELPYNHPLTSLNLKKINSNLHGNKFIYKEAKHEWMGFSCDSEGDLIPCKKLTIDQQVKEAFLENDKREYVYRNIDFVVSECEKLSKEIMYFEEIEFVASECEKLSKGIMRFRETDYEKRSRL